MRALVTNKTTNNKYEVMAEKVKGQWMIGGDYPDYKNEHYEIISNDNIHYSLRNGRLVKV